MADGLASEQRTDPIDPLATPRQIKFIQALAREQGMSDDEMSHELALIFGRAMSELSRRDASLYIERLQTRNFRD